MARIVAERITNYAVTVGTSRVLGVPARPGRKHLVLQADTANTVAVFHGGPGVTATGATKGIAIPKGTFNSEGGMVIDGYEGQVYFIAASASQVVCVIETYAGTFS